MYAFTFHRPQTVRQAANLLGKNEDAKLLAGGQTLLPTMKLRLAGPPQIVDMTLIEGLSGIEMSGRSLTIGAMTKHFEVNSSPVVQQAAPVLAKMAGMIGDPAVRHRGTIGGSVANNDPNADYPAACLALGATIITNKRSIQADDFFKGLFTTALEDGEIITSVAFPVSAKAGYAKFPHPASRFALTGVFVARTTAGDVRAAATGASQNGVMRVGAIEAALKANWSASALDGITISADGLLTDIQGSSIYRANLIKVMAKRAVAAAG
jgi:aerobic carbon-monoxide dehydrogenase medium subunit